MGNGPMIAPWLFTYTEPNKGTFKGKGSINCCTLYLYILLTRVGCTWLLDIGIYIFLYFWKGVFSSPQLSREAKYFLNKESFAKRTKYGFILHSPNCIRFQNVYLCMLFCTHFVTLLVLSLFEALS
jgi:hypothetical protein